MSFTTFVLQYQPQRCTLISLNSLGFYLSPECLLSFLWLIYSTICGKTFSIYGVRIRKWIESMHFYSCPSSPLKTPGTTFFLKIRFPQGPRTKGWRKLWFALLKFNQKIWRWHGTLVYLYVVWFIIFLNVMALLFCE